MDFPAQILTKETLYHLQESQMDPILVQEESKDQTEFGALIVQVPEVYWSDFAIWVILLLGRGSIFGMILSARVEVYLPFHAMVVFAWLYVVVFFTAGNAASTDEQRGLFAYDGGCSLNGNDCEVYGHRKASFEY